MGIEKAKLRDLMPFRTGVSKSVGIDNDSTFRDSVRNVFNERQEDGFSGDSGGVEENASGQDESFATGELSERTGDVMCGEVSEEMQLAALVSIMAGANVTVAVPMYEHEVEVQAKQETPVAEKAQVQNDAQSGDKTNQKVAETVFSQSVPVSDKQAGKVFVGQSQMSTAEQHPLKKGSDATEKTFKQVETAKNGQQFVTKQTEANQVQAKPFETKQAEVRDVRQDVTAFVKPEQLISSEKIYVKVGENRQIDNEDFANKLSEKIVKNLTSDGTKMFEIEFMPRDLGKIVVKLIVSNGVAQVIVQCMNPKTQQLVMMNSDSIRNIVEEKTGLNASVTVEDKPEAYDARDGKDGSNKQKQEQKQDDNKVTEGETDIFLNRLRLGFADIVQA
jgi:hypothetical protein